MSVINDWKALKNVEDKKEYLKTHPTLIQQVQSMHANLLVQHQELQRAVTEQQERLRTKRSQYWFSAYLYT